MDVGCIISIVYVLAAAKSVTALVLLCYLLPDTRSKSDHNKVITFVPVSTLKGSSHNMLLGGGGGGGGGGRGGGCMHGHMQ